MRIWLLSLAFVAVCDPVVRAQEHLIPAADVFENPDDYDLKVRHVFARVFDKGVTLRVLVTPSFVKEYAVGLFVTDEKVEVFVLDPSSQIWNTELIKMYEEGKLMAYTRKGKKIPLEENEAYKRLKKSAPSDYRAIKTTRKARPISKELAEEIKSLWDEMLLKARHPSEPVLGMDGVTYDFSADIKGRGELSGHIWSPEPESKTGRFTKLAETMADYARGKADLRKLMERLKAAREP
jgi:hypothetical protein